MALQAIIYRFKAGIENQENTTKYVLKNKTQNKQ